MDILYLASKIFTFFLAPFTWIAGLLIWRSLTTSTTRKKTLLIAAISIFIAFSNQALYIATVNAWQPKPVNLEGKKFFTGIVLGGIVAFDKNRNGYFREDADRFYQACKLYRRGTIKNILISGGTVAANYPEEADFIKNQMIALGVVPGDVITETVSKTTFENAVFSKRIIDSLKLPAPFVLITSALHMPRAAKLFTKAGVAVVPFPCAYAALPSNQLSFDDYFLPKLEVLVWWKGLIKEIAGTAIYRAVNKA